MPSPCPAGPRPWLLAAPVPNGPWRLLLYYWTYGPHWRPDDPLPAHGEVVAWPKRKTCAADLGVPYDTIKTWHRWLVVHGWVKRLEDGIALAVGEPCAAWIADQSGPAKPGSSQTRVQPNPGPAKPDPGSSQTRPPGPAKPDPGSSQTRPPGLAKPDPGSSQTRPSKPPKNQLVEPAREPANWRAGPAPQLALVHPEPDRDLPAEVFAHLRARIIAAKRDLGIKPAAGPRVLSPRQRAAVAARIREHGGGEAGLEACRRVIAVDEQQARGDPSGSGPAWRYWNATTPFRNAENFGRRLDAWREDGNHATGSGQRRSRGQAPQWEPVEGSGYRPASDAPIADAALLKRVDGVD